MPSFEEQCKRDGFDSTGTLFFVAYNDRICRWNKGILVPTDFFIQEWGDFEVEHNIYGRCGKFSGSAFTENNSVYIRVRNGMYHCETGPSAIGIATEGRGAFIRWHQNDILHNGFGPASVRKANTDMACDYYLNGKHVGVYEFATHFLISHLEEYVAPTEDDMLKLYQSEMAIIEKMKYNNDGKP